MKRVIICGDSFMSPRTNHPKKHFAEIFADELQFDLITYARSGFSNGAITIQVESAIAEKPDFILFNTTHQDRIEFAIDAGKIVHNNHRIEQLADTNLQTAELSDELYRYDSKKVLVSANLAGLLNKQQDEYWENLYSKEMHQRYDDWDEKLDTVKRYVKHLYSDGWKYQTDCMIMYATWHRLHLSGIPYIFVHDYLGILNSPYNPKWIETKNSVHDYAHELRMSEDPPPSIGFHLSYENSDKLAHFLINHYKTYF